MPFQLLSQGIERFLKVYICLAYFNEKDAFPPHTEIRRLSHHLDKSYNDIINNYYPKYKSPQHILDDTFLRTNKDIIELLNILSEFGKGTRYYNFDLITEDPKHAELSTKEAWEVFENKLIDSSNYIKLMQEDTKNEVRQKIVSYIIVVFERFISALSRQFIFKGLGQQATQLSVSNFFNFGMIYEDNFGTTDYRYQTQRYQYTPRKVHKRTVYDELNRKFNEVC